MEELKFIHKGSYSITIIPAGYEGHTLAALKKLLYRKQADLAKLFSPVPAGEWPRPPVDRLAGIINLSKEIRNLEYTVFIRGMIKNLHARPKPTGHE